MTRCYVALLLLSFFFSCQRDVSYVGGPDVPAFIGETVSPDPVTAALQGNVFDETGAPASGVTINVGNKTATTNANGYFRINEAALDKKSAVVTAVKAGYFKGYRTFAATTGANNVEIKLVKKSLAGSVDASAGGEVSLSNGYRIALSANSVVNAATGAAYTGSVKIYAAAIDPTAADIAQTVPGSFMANDKNGKRVLLSSYGMTAVELESASGDKLQIKSGSTAKLTTVVPSSLQASAPATIALWSVDESTGIWKEEGTATKSGNAYVGEVKHFSFWNCDVSANAVVLSMTLKNNDGNPLVHARVTLKQQNTNWVVHGFTDSLGQVSGYIPYNEPLLMELVDQCNTAFYSQAIGPFKQAANLGVITVNNTGTSVVTVKGKLTNCSGSSVTSGYALITFGYRTQYAAVNASGEFHTTFTKCSSSPTTVSVVGVDANAQQQSNATSVSVTTPVTDAGTITACGTSSSEFVNYTLDGTAYNLSSPVDSVSGATVIINNVSNTSIRAFQLNAGTVGSTIKFTFQSPAQTAGTYNMSIISVNNFDNTTISTPIPVVVTTFPAAGGFYEGSFAGQFTANGTPHTISGTFQTKRQW